MKKKKKNSIKQMKKKSEFVAIFIWSKKRFPFNVQENCDFIELTELFFLFLHFQ